MKTILATGGAGYIGSHAFKTLVSAGYKPVVIDNLSTGHRWAVKWGPLVEGHIADRHLVRRILEKYHVDAVMHFAANVLVGESMESPYKYLHDNAANSLELLEAMRETGVRRIAFSSTCATYGVPQQIPISGRSAQAPVNPYGESKLLLERALSWYARCHFWRGGVALLQRSGSRWEGERLLDRRRCEGLHLGHGLHAPPDLELFHSSAVI
jgi:UDP-arabinose 4-epimerase